MSTRATPHTSHLQTAGRPTVFLDRDGTLNVQVIKEGRPYPPASVDAFTLLPDVQDACRALSAAGYQLIVVTNQPDVGRGTQLQSAVEAMHVQLRLWVPEIVHVEACYDGGDTPSRRRKPEPGMLLDCAQQFGVDLAASWMIGDRWRDVDCGKRAGVRTILIDCGYTEALRSLPDFTVKTFAEAARIVLAHR
jgi:D-glycero-D-manno-heptose 1,7-bisphosphate phosphatase